LSHEAGVRHHDPRRQSLCRVSISDLGGNQLKLLCAAPGRLFGPSRLSHWSRLGGELACNTYE
jgi:hypothetical protein